MFSFWWPAFLSFFVFDSFILQRIRFQWNEVPFEYFLTSVCYKVIVKSLSHARLFATPWTVACQAPPSMGFSRQGYWSGLPFCSPGHLPDPGIEPRSPTLMAGCLPSEPPKACPLFGSHCARHWQHSGQK